MIAYYQSMDGMWWDCAISPIKSDDTNLVWTPGGRPTAALAICVVTMMVRENIK